MWTIFKVSSPVAYWAPTNLGSSSFSVISFCLFILFMRFSRQQYWSGLRFPSPGGLPWPRDQTRCLLLGRRILYPPISYLTTSNVPWFMDLTFQVPMQYCSLQRRTLLPSLVTFTTGLCFHFGSFSSFFLELFLHSSPVAGQPHVNPWSQITLSHYTHTKKTQLGSKS